jgi:hypothetical protein
MSTDNDQTVLGKMETIKHIHRVRHFMCLTIQELDRRAREHDQSKLESPEAEIYGEHYPKLAKCEYMSPEYKESIEHVRPAIEHHYKLNRHHPEFHPEGVNSMNFADMVEMLADWRAASERNPGGNLIASIQKNAARYGLSPQLVRIMENTARDTFPQ